MHRVFDAAIDKAVLNLVGADRGIFQSLLEHGGGEVGNAKLPNFAPVVEGAEGVPEGGEVEAGAVPMDLDVVERVPMEVAQGVVEFVLNLLGGGDFAEKHHFGEDFGVGAAFEKLAEQFFAAAIDVGGVEGVNTPGEIGIDDALYFIKGKGCPTAIIKLPTSEDEAVLSSSLGGGHGKPRKMFSVSGGCEFRGG